MSQYENKKPQTEQYEDLLKLYMLVFVRKRGSISHNISEKYFKMVYAQLSGLGFRDAVKRPFNFRS